VPQRALPEEPDAERIITFLTEHGEQVHAPWGTIPARFPTLAKTLYSFLGEAQSRHGLAAGVLGFLRNRRLAATEYQLFWLAATGAGSGPGVRRIFWTCQSLQACRIKLSCERYSLRGLGGAQEDR